MLFDRVNELMLFDRVNELMLLAFVKESIFGSIIYDVTLVIKSGELVVDVTVAVPESKIDIIKAGTLV
jgi:hypothetical protein